VALRGFATRSSGKNSLCDRKEFISFRFRPFNQSQATSAVLVTLQDLGVSAMVSSGKRCLTAKGRKPAVSDQPVPAVDVSAAGDGVNRERLLVDAPEAARLLSISLRLLWTYTADGRIPSVRIGRRVLYPVAKLRAWLETQATATAQGRD
jgi:excisionase family DNA binding protein